jgi:hypothetical protein
MIWEFLADSVRIGLFYRRSRPAAANVIIGTGFVNRNFMTSPFAIAIPARRISRS